MLLDFMLFNISKVSDDEYDNFYFIPNDNGVWNYIIGFPDGNYLLQDSKKKIETYVKKNTKIITACNF